MKDFCDVLKCFVIIECFVDLMVEKKYIFEVDVRVNKIEVKDVVESIFGVKVDKVNIMNYKGKLKCVGCYIGMISCCRKVIVKFIVDSKEIEIFEV